MATASDVHSSSETSMETLKPSLTMKVWPTEDGYVEESRAVFGLHQGKELWIQHKQFEGGVRCIMVDTTTNLKVVIPVASWNSMVGKLKNLEFMFSSECDLYTSSHEIVDFFVCKMNTSEVDFLSKSTNTNKGAVSRIIAQHSNG